MAYVPKSPETGQVVKLLEEFPLYKKVEVESNSWVTPSSLSGITFKFACKNDGSQTFKLIAQPRSLLHLFSNLDGGRYDSGTLYEISDGKSQYNYFQYYSGYCQYCNSYKVDFLIHIETNPKCVQLSKVGQYPAFSIKPDAELYRWLSGEDKAFYDKAILCKSQNYGIGAYAYLRRIVQNEIVRIVEDLSKIDTADSDKIKDLLATYNTDRQMEKLITGVSDYMPKSFENLEDNPMKFLYHELSGGIHAYSEDECFDKAAALDTVLKFVIKKINEENSDLKQVREALKRKQK